jgi:predicted MFS family arabinose efflux permease
VLLGERFGRIGPLAFGIALSALGVLVLMSAEGLPRYVLGGSCLGFTWAFCLPYIQGFIASLDRHGSALAAGASASTIGGAAGPGLAASIVGDGHYQHVFLATIALFAIALTGFVASGSRIRRPAPETPR